MHGNLSQAQRNRVLQAFRSGRLTTLVATDVVGRGIDVRGVSHVVNFDLPDDPTHYVHRIGRTGRMGNDGVAFSLVLPDQGKMLDQIERCIPRELEGDQVEGIPRRPPARSAAPQAVSARAPSGRPSGTVARLASRASAAVATARPRARAASEPSRRRSSRTEPGGSRSLAIRRSRSSTREPLT